MFEEYTKGRYDRKPEIWAPKKTPTPSSWFDADYFDVPRRKGALPFPHVWANCRKHYLNLAHMVLAGFPFSGSFLDVGCGRGLLERAMFELALKNGLEFDVTGFDYSEYAIATADGIAKPFVVLDSVEGFRFERTYDVLLLFNVLEYLTDDQAWKFLRRASERINHALFAIVDRPASEGTVDFGAINRKETGGWMEIFAISGWTQDGEAEIMQELAGLHTFVKYLKADSFYFIPKSKRGDERDVAD